MNNLEKTLVIGLLAFFVGHSAARADTPEQLIAAWYGIGAAPGACQEQGCEAREAIARLLKQRGYCYSPDAWRRCKPVPVLKPGN